MAFWKSFWQSVSMYSIVPVPGLKWDSRGDRHMLAMYPLVGLLIGGIWLGIARLLIWLGIAPMPLGALLTAVPFVLTGFLHLDGYMDVCDAVLSRRDRARRLEILRDSHTGAFAVISVGLLFLLQFSAVYELAQKPERLWGFLLLPVLSRGMAGFGLLQLPLLEGSSMGAWARQNTGIGHKIFLLAAAVLAGAGMTVLCGWTGLAASLAGAAGYWLAAWYACGQLGGVSGDTSGYSLCLSELAALMILAIV